MDLPADDLRRLLSRTAELAADHLFADLDAPVSQPVDVAELVATLGGPLPDGPSDPSEVVETLARDVAPGLVRTNGGRYFGFVEGGVLPAALAADWLASTYDQNPAFHVLSPAAAALETVCAGWLLELLGLPSDASVGFTTGAQMANVAGLAAARGEVLRRVGWDVDADGLHGAPPVTVVVGEERHATIGRALRFLGLGERRVVVVPADDQGRMEPGPLRGAIGDGPAIVCAQAGNVNTGASDPFSPIVEAAHEVGAWVHVDGAFGLWAAASPAHRHLVAGVDLADSWATDGHKWLNVPYDGGFVICADPEAHRRAMTLSASYLARTDGGRDGTDWTPESSRRARAFATWAALRSLGRSGVADLVAHSCEQTGRLVRLLSDDPAVSLLNDVVLNQALLRIGDDDARTLAVAAEVQRDGVTWLGTTVRRGVTALRISVSDHATTDEDIEVAAAAVRRAIVATADANGAAIRTELPAPVPRPHPASAASAPLRIAVLAGGANSERNVSLSSGQAIARALRGLGHAVALIDSAQPPVVAEEDPAQVFLTTEVAGDDLSDTPVAPTAAGPPGLEALAQARDGQTQGGVLASGLLPILRAADVVFVTVFGDEGESGSTQRLLDEHAIVHTGPTAAVCELTFDKARTKAALVDHGIDTPAWHVVRRDHVEEDLDRLAIAGPWIVKPVAGGSSIGMTRVEDAAALPAACAAASAEGQDALVEEFLEGRDFTIGVLGDRVFAVVGTSTDRDLYDYEAKYSPGAARKQVPADLSAAQTEEVRRLTGEVHRLLDIGDTSSRSDFRLTSDGRFNFFETNPLPGMTPTSSYPLSLGADGVTFPEVCEELVLRALRRAGREMPTTTDREGWRT